MGLKKKIEELLIPERENNFHARLLEPVSLLVLLLIFLGAQLSLRFVAFARPGVLGYSSEITPEKIVALTNEERIKHGLEPLTINNVLSQAAQLKAGDMFAFDYWSHQSPSGREPWSFLEEAGYNYRLAGENLARDFYGSEAVVQAWMESPTHRENIINSKYREIGVAVVDGTLGGIKTTLVVQFFGTPTYVSASQPAGPERTQPLAAAEQAMPEAEVDEPLISPLNISQKLGGFVIGVLIVVMLVDGYIVLQNRIYRSTGRTTAHISFLLFIGLIILLSSQPGIIG